MVERQMFVTWYTPEEKLPKEGYIVVASVSGSRENVCYDHAFMLVEWYEGDGFYPTELDDMDDFTVHAWCDLVPYAGGT